MDQNLVIERPNKDLEVVPWDDKTMARFKFKSDELSELDADNIVWRNDIAFYLEEA